MKTEIYYFDENDKLIDDKDKAVKIIIREIDDDGEIINETLMFKKGYLADK